tara:strand:- start:14 stop:385 length:372 start_codon:yes stop_codon:yes gene_type:complete
MVKNLPTIMRPFVLRLVAVTFLIILGCHCSFRGKRVLAQAASPDGNWSVAVTGKRLWSGAIEVGARTSTSEGQAVSHGVIDLCNDWNAAEQKYHSIEIDNQAARTGGRTFLSPNLDPHNNRSL